MTDEIMHVIAVSLKRILDSKLYASGTDELLRDLQRAGYEIEPKWSTDLDSAPRDGTPVELIVQLGEPPFAQDNPYRVYPKAAYLNGKWCELRGPIIPSVPIEYAGDEDRELGPRRTVTHWKPITPPKESDE